MDSLFIQNSQLLRWVDQIIEKLIIVCLLEGRETEQEFNQGRALVGKVLEELQRWPVDTDEKRRQVMNQLLEQRLPDQRIVHNFSGWKEIMDRMVQEGIERFKDEKNPAPLMAAEPVLSASSRVVLSAGRIVRPDQKQQSITIRPYSLTVQEEEENPEDFLIPVMAKAELGGEEMQPGEIVENKRKEHDSPVIEEARLPAPSDDREHLQPPVNEISRPLKKEPEIFRREGHRRGTPYIKSKKQPDNLLEPAAREPIKELQFKEKLRSLLAQIFPGAIIHWDLTLAGRTFTAQVGRCLFYITEKDNDVKGRQKTLLEQGWKIIGLTKEDLSFPRRVRRVIRQADYDDRQNA
ncbi:MAG: hypothetical protein LBT22_08150 [Peptococcaceae bacterium]|nr:hypothetical protein [Peptococcaceae bacterium]